MSSKTFVLITGGNRGLGRAYAQALLGGSRGSTYKIGITARSLQSAQTAAKELSDKGQVVGYGCDIEQEDQVAKLKDAVERDFGRVDVLINNAGAAYDYQALGGQMTMREAWLGSFSLNVVANHFFTEAFVPLLLKSTSPSILFIGSNVGSISLQVDKGIPSMDASPEAGWPKEVSFDFPSAYRSSKAGFNMMAREWHRTLLNDKVKCYILSMSGYATELGGADPAQKAKAGIPGPEVAGEWVREFVEGEHEGEEGKFMALEGERGW